MEVFGLVNVLEGTNPIISINNLRLSKEYNVKVLKANSFDDFKGSFEYFTKYKNKNLDLSNYTEIFSGKLESFNENNKDFIELPFNIEKGNYLVQILGEELNYSVFMEAGKHQIYYMKTNEEEMFWIVNSFENKNADNCEISLGQKKVGVTGTDGVLVTKLNDNKIKEMFVARIDDYEYLIKTFATMDNYYYDDYMDGDGYWSFIYTDRNVYMNTDEINIFTFIKSYDGKRIKNAKIVLSDYRSNDILLEQKIKLASGESNKALLKFNDLEDGEYKIFLVVNDKNIAYSQIEIKSYEKPEILLTSTINKKNNLFR